MAKKKMSKKEAPSRAKKSSPMGWIVAAIVVIAIIAYFVTTSNNAPVQQNQPAPSNNAGPVGGLTKAEAPTFEKKCTVAIGIVPGTKTVTNNVVSVTFKNNGRIALEGTYFSFADASGKVVYRKNSDAVEPGKTIAYTVDLNEVATELGSAVKAFIVYPIQDGKACDNQKAIVIGTPSSNY